MDWLLAGSTGRGTPPRTGDIGAAAPLQLQGVVMTDAATGRAAQKNIREIASWRSSGDGARRMLEEAGEGGVGGGGRGRGGGQRGGRGGAHAGPGGESSAGDARHRRVTLECSDSMQDLALCEGRCGKDRWLDASEPNRADCKACNQTRCEIGFYRVRCTSRFDGYCTKCTNAPSRGAEYIMDENVFDTNCSWVCSTGYKLEILERQESSNGFGLAGGEGGRTILDRQCRSEIDSQNITLISPGSVLLMIIFLSSFGVIYVTICVYFWIPACIKRLRARSRHAVIDQDNPSDEQRHGNSTVENAVEGEVTVIYPDGSISRFSRTDSLPNPNTINNVGGGLPVGDDVVLAGMYQLGPGEHTQGDDKEDDGGADHGPEGAVVDHVVGVPAVPLGQGMKDSIDTDASGEPWKAGLSDADDSSRIERQ
jgi:hypothetical protein